MRRAFKAFLDGIGAHFRIFSSANARWGQQTKAVQIKMVAAPIVTPFASARFGKIRIRKDE
jgi:hypothetical protein